MPLRSGNPSSVLETSLQRTLRARYLTWHSISSRKRFTQLRSNGSVSSRISAFKPGSCVLGPNSPLPLRPQNYRSPYDPDTENPEQYTLKPHIQNNESHKQNAHRAKPRPPNIHSTWTAVTQVPSFVRRPPTWKRPRPHEPLDSGRCISVIVT